MACHASGSPDKYREIGSCTFKRPRSSRSMTQAPVNCLLSEAILNFVFRGVVCAPFFVAHPVCLLENNSSLDSYQNGSPKKMVSSFGANVCIILLRRSGSVRLAEGTRGSDSEDDAQNGRSECDV